MVRVRADKPQFLGVTLPFLPSTAGGVRSCRVVEDKGFRASKPSSLLRQDPEFLLGASDCGVQLLGEILKGTTSPSICSAIQQVEYLPIFDMRRWQFGGGYGIGLGQKIVWDCVTPKPFHYNISINSANNKASNGSRYRAG